MKSLALKCWNSPTLNTWASFFGRTMGAVLVLPLVLKRFSVEDFNIWSLFSTLLGLQMLADLGFASTFVRAIAVSLAGAPNSDAFLRHANFSPQDGPNWLLLNRVVSSMRFIYGRLSIGYLVLLATLGSAFLYKPISQSTDPKASWLAWGVVAFSGYFTLRGNYLVVLLQGLNQVAVARRWEAITSAAAVVCGAIALLMGARLLGLVAVMQFWSWIAVLRNEWLCRNILDGRFQKLPLGQRDAEILLKLWPAAWRSGVGVLMSFGLVQLTGLVNAQFASASNSASYLLCLRLMQMLSTFSQAPFYSKLPIFPKLRAEGKFSEMLKVAGTGMRNSLWTYSCGFAAGGLLGPLIFKILKSKVEFPDTFYWILFGLIYFIERYAAMHLQLYSSTNHIVTHIANGVTGLISIAFAAILVPLIGLSGMPLALLAGYSLFYSWYPVRLSYKEFGVPFAAFEKNTSLPPVLIFATSSAIMIRFGSI